MSKIDCDDMNVAELKKACTAKGFKSSQMKRPDLLKCCKGGNAKWLDEANQPSKSMKIDCVLSSSMDQGRDYLYKQLDCDLSTLSKKFDMKKVGRENCPDAYLNHQSRNLNVNLKKRKEY